MNLALLTADAAIVRAPLAPRTYLGNMCGIHVPGLPPIEGGSPDPTLVLSWFYPRFAPEWRAKIRAAYKSRGYLDVLLSWPDDRAFGLSARQHAAMCQELCRDGLRPCVMLSSKVYDPQDDGKGTFQNLWPALLELVDADCVSRYCVGFELNLWNTFDSLQFLVDAIAPLVQVKRRPLYVHFSPGYADWRPNVPGSTFADYWNRQVGKLTGLWHQRDQAWSNDEYRGRLTDILARFSGQFGVVADSGFGHPFDLIELEISADDQYWGRITESEGDALARFALETPAVNGVRVMGSGNGWR